jgi:cell filamentation protein
MRDPYLYDDCDVLKNKLNIKDSATLDKAEVDISCNALHDISVSPIPGEYDFAHFCSFHRRIFGAVYAWAGTPRTIQIQKAEPVLGEMSIIYALPNAIESSMTRVLDHMLSINWSYLSLDEQAQALADCLTDLWQIHAFREGNTRTTVTFICQYADSVGLTLDRELFERNSAYIRTALVAASAVFPDGDFRKPEYLRTIIKDGLERGAGAKRK